MYHDASSIIIWTYPLYFYYNQNTQYWVLLGYFKYTIREKIRKYWRKKGKGIVHEWISGTIHRDAEFNHPSWQGLHDSSPEIPLQHPQCSSSLSDGRWPRHVTGSATRECTFWEVEQTYSCDINSLSSITVSIRECNAKVWSIKDLTMMNTG